MTFWTLIRRSLRFHARAHLGVVLGAAIGSAALIGALVVGDSVRGSLRQRALDRVGKVQYLLESRDRLLTDDTDRWRGVFGEGYALGLHLPAIASTSQSAARANQVNLYGVQPRFWGLAEAETNIRIETNSVLLNQPLAAQLEVKAGDTVVLRFLKPAPFSSEEPLSPQSKTRVALRLKVQGILTAAQLGGFSPAASATPARNAFMRLDQLQQAAQAAWPSRNFVLGAWKDGEACRGMLAKARLRASAVEFEAWTSDLPRWLLPASLR